MGERIDEFCEELRVKLTKIDTGMSALKAKIGGEARQAEQEVRKHLDRVQSHIAQQRAKITAAEAEIKSWADEKKASTSEKVAEWKAKHEVSRLKNRADKAEHYAAASMLLAIAAVDNAEQAALEAWLARQDAQSAEIKK